jgi:hypothetical protein
MQIADNAVKEAMNLRIQKLNSLTILLLTCLVVGTSASPVLGQESVSEILNRFLRENGGFSETDVSKIEKGGLVSRVLKSDDKRRINVLGVASISAPVSKVEKAFDITVGNQRNRDSEGFGTFSSPPDRSEFDRIKIISKEVESLRKCRVGNCGLRLSESQIHRFQNEVEWDSPDYKKQAIDLYRDILFEYLVSYIEHGDTALIDYADKQKTLSLSNEIGSLHKQISWVDGFAPEFRSLAKAYPKSNTNFEQSLIWSRVKFGLKPMIIITHTITYRGKDESANPVVIKMAKQIYANHYIDSSLGLTLLIGLPGKNKQPETRLLFTNFTRADSFGSGFGRIAKKVVEREAAAKLNSLLTATRRNALISDRQAPATDSVEDSGTGYILWIAGAVLLVAVCSFAFYASRNR